MSVKNYTVSLCNRNEIKEFIETYHYSKNINGISSPYCFKLLDNGDMIGAMVYGYIAMQGVWKKYAEKETDLIELRRLCCIDDTPKNTESYFIGHTLRWLRDNTEIKKVILNFDSISENEILNLTKNKKNKDNFKLLKTKLLYDYYIKSNQLEKAKQIQRNFK